jgi:hypothetical protein
VRSKRRIAWGGLPLCLICLVVGLVPVPAASAQELEPVQYLEPAPAAVADPCEDADDCLALAELLRRDADGDGFPRAADCDDTDARRNPGAEDVPGNGVDEDCSGADGPDRDGDGFSPLGSPRDCDDRDRRVNPGARERRGNGVDENCDGIVEDVDGDGALATGDPADCDDLNARRRPGARDVPANGVDEDCDGYDAGPPRVDRDDDGASPPADCDDADARIRPGATDEPGNGVDEDCAGGDAAPPAVAASSARPPVAVAAPASPAAASASPRFLRPFPMTRVRGMLVARGVRVRMITVHGPATMKVRVRCRGLGCPRRLRGVRRGSVVRFGAFRGTLRPGAVLEIWATQAGAVGKYTRFTIRRGRMPLRRDLCVAPGRSRPVSCGSL